MARVWAAVFLSRARNLVVTAFLVLVSHAAAQHCAYEAEPNDHPPVATPIAVSGPGTVGPPPGTRLPVVCLAGDATGGQDLFVWTVDEEAAGHSWRLEIEGIPDRLTAAEVFLFTFTPDGQGVTDGTSLYLGSSRAVPQPPRMRSWSLLACTTSECRGRVGPQSASCASSQPR